MRTFVGIVCAAVAATGISSLQASERFDFALRFGPPQPENSMEAKPALNLGRAPVLSDAGATDGGGPLLAWFNSRAGADADGRYVGFRPLHAAAINNRVDTAIGLIERGARVDATDELGRTPLMVAAAFGNRDVADVLLGAGADSRIRDSVHGDTALHFAAMAGRKDVAALLLSYGADINARAGGNGETPLHYAALFGHLDTIELLVAKGAKVDATDNSGVRPLEYASKRYRGPTVDLLRRLGARPMNLFDAVNSGDIGQLNRLLAGGADVNARGLLGTSLHLAAARGQVWSAAVLIDADADLEAEGEPAASRPLHVAALNNQPEIVNLLVDRGAAVDVRDAEGRTPLMVSAIFGSPAAAAALLSHGADPVARDGSYGDTPIHMAAISGDIDIAAMLLARGVDINLASGHGGETPAHYASCSGKIEMLAFLAAEGADLNRPDDRGGTPLRYVEQHNKSPAAVAMLLRLGAH